jgi:hypothetical protein
VKFRALPSQAVGDLLEPYLYQVLRLDPHRFVFDLPSSMRGVGGSRVGAGGSGGGTKEGFVFERGKPDHPVGKVIFLTTDRKFREADPESRADFERMG